MPNGVPLTYTPIRRPDPPVLDPRMVLAPRFEEELRRLSQLPIPRPVAELEMGPAEFPIPDPAIRARQARGGRAAAEPILDIGLTEISPEPIAELPEYEEALAPTVGLEGARFGIPAPLGMADLGGPLPIPTGTGLLDVSGLPMPGLPVSGQPLPVEFEPQPDGVPAEPPDVEVPGEPLVEDEVEPELPPAERAAAEAGAQAQMIADARAEQGEQAAGYMRGFADRMREIHETDQKARDEVLANTARIRQRLSKDADELRALSREAAEGKLGRGTMAGILVGGALQAIKSLIGAGQADTSFIDGLLQRDGDAKARAVVEARRRMGITEGEVETESGRLQQLDYLKKVSIADSWDQIAADLQADAAEETNVELKLQKQTAYERAAAAAQQAGIARDQAAWGQELEFAKKRQDIALTAAKTRKEVALATREERRGRGVGRRKPTPILVTDLPPEWRQAAMKSPEAAKVFRKMMPKMARDPYGNILLNPDGTPWQVADIAQRKEVAGMIADMATINEITNKLVAMRNEHGWERTATLWATGAGQEMQALQTMLSLIEKDAFELGVLTGPDMDLLNQVTGGDPTGFKDPTPALERTRQELNSKLEIRLKTIGGPVTIPWLITSPGAAREKLSTVRSLVETGVNPETGQVPSSAERASAAQREYDILVRDLDGDFEAASEIYARRGERDIVPKLRHDLETMVSMRSAALDDEDSKLAETLRRSINEQRKYITKYRSLIQGEAEKLAKSRVVKKKTEAVRQRFEFWRGPPGR